MIKVRPRVHIGKYDGGRKDKTRWFRGITKNNLQYLYKLWLKVAYPIKKRDNR